MSLLDELLLGFDEALDWPVDDDHDDPVPGEPWPIRHSSSSSAH